MINLKPSTPATLPGALRHGLANSLRLFLPGAVIFAVAALQPIPMDFVPPEQGAAAAAAPARLERLLDRGQCWQGEAPAEMQGVIPGHVWADGRLRGERAVGQALEQIFDGVDHDLTVLAFCR